MSNLPNNLDAIFPEGFWICANPTHPFVGIAKNSACTICGQIEDAGVVSFISSRAPINLKVWDPKLKIFSNWNSVIPLDSKDLVVLRGSGVSDRYRKEIFEGDYLVYQDNTDDKYLITYQKGAFHIGDLGLLNDYVLSAISPPHITDFRIFGSIFE